MKANDQITRYHKFADIPDPLLEEARVLTKNSPYRQTYHIEPETGYLNDPNGFTYVNGKYHLCYQWTPLRYLEGKNVWYQAWYHLESVDLINWRPLGPLLEPDTVYESHGVYSGSAIDNGKELLIFYTGNTRDENWIRTPYQIIARVNENGDVVKELPPAISGVVNGYTDHFRDPKIWKHNQEFYALAGIQRENKSGASMLLHSMDGSQWVPLGEIQTSYKTLGYMWECPDYFELDDNGVLLFCAQGLNNQHDPSTNIYSVLCLVGKPLDYETLSFEHNDYQTFDHGFDIYALQSMMTPDGRRIMVGWMGISDMQYPTEQYGYCGTLTIPRELTVREGKLFQNPARELESLRTAHELYTPNISKNNPFKVKSGASFESKIKFKHSGVGCIYVAIRSNADCSKSILITVDLDKNQLILDREKSGIAINEKFGTTRVVNHKFDNEIQLRLFSDTSSVELFIDDGAVALSNRIFPDNNQEYLVIWTESEYVSASIELWQLTKSKNLV